MGLLDSLFYGGMQEQQGDPQGALLSELLKLQQPQQQPALPTGHVMPQAQAQPPPAPNFLDRLSAMSRGYGEGGLVGGIADAVNLGDSRGERAQAQQRNHTLEYLTANKIDPQTAQMAISNPDLMKSLLGSVVSKRYGDKGEEFKEINKRGYALSRGPDGKVALRLLDGQGGPAGTNMLPGTIEGAPYEDPEKVVNLVKGLRGDFEQAPAYKAHAIVSPAYRNIDAAFKSDSAAGDMAALYAFVKLLDPTSVVRESEFATAAASGSWGDQVKVAVERAATGKRLTPEMRADFARQAKNIYGNSQTAFKKHQDNYRGMSKRLFIDDANVVYDIENAEQPETAQPPAPQQGQRLDMGAVQGRSGPLVAPPVRISSDAEYDKLPSGTPFMGPDGIARRKP
jgi:hypothetical protein